MAAGDIVPVTGEWFEETLASASPDLLRTMVRQMAQRMMDAEVEQGPASDNSGSEVTGPSRRRTASVNSNSSSAQPVKHRYSRRRNTPSPSSAPTR